MLHEQTVDEIVGAGVERIRNGYALHAIAHLSRDAYDPLHTAIAASLHAVLDRTDGRPLVDVLVELNAIIAREYRAGRLTEKNRWRLLKIVFGPAVEQVQPDQIEEVLRAFENIRTLEGCRSTVLIVLVIALFYAILLGLTSCSGISSAVDVYDRISDRARVDTTVYKIKIRVQLDTVHVKLHNDSTSR